MSKPLELTVYETDPSDPDCVVINGYWEYRPHTTAKRLTDAELAAETYKGEAEFRAAAGYGYSADIIRECDRKRSIMERFATLPHYDQEEAQA